MLLLVVYCGFMFSFVSTSSNNQTSNERINISTALPAMSNLSSIGSTGSKHCTLEMKDSEISQIVELFNNDLVHVVDIAVSLSNVSHGKELLSDFHVQLMNPIGREILFALDFNVPWFKTLPWTLTVGIKHFKLHVLESQNGCIRNKTKATEFVWQTVQNIVRTINLGTKYDVWISFKDISSGKELKGCCHMTKLNMLECNDGCSKSNSYLSGCFWNGSYSILVFVFLLCFTWCVLHLQSLSDFDVEYSEYYKLEDSRMSPSFIFFKIIWEENGRIIACIRVCALAIGFIAFSRFFFELSFLAITASVFLGLGAVAYVISKFLSGESTALSLSEFSELKKKRIEFPLIFNYKFLVWYGYDAVQLWEELKSSESIFRIKILTLLFNKKFWRKASKTVNQKIATFTAKHEKFNNRTLKFLAKCLCYAITLFIYSLLVVLTFGSPSLDFVTLINSRLFLVSSGFKLKDYSTYLSVLFLVLPFKLLTTLAINEIPQATVSFFLGLFLNLIFFIPYLAFFSVLIFYCVSYWKSMEENYLLLKQLIYEACRNTKHDNDDFIPNRRLKRNDKVLPVVSKELYDKIREKLLPYDENLFYLAAKLFCAFAFSYIIFQLIIMLREFEVTGFIQVLITASVGVMPHILNMATMKTSEQMKQAWKEKMKLNVKYMVDELVHDDLELAQTEVIIPWREDDKQIFNELIELLQTWKSDNDQVIQVNEEIAELLRTELMIHQEYETTIEMTGDNNQVNEERVEPPETEVMIHQEHDTTNEMTDDNDQVNEERVELHQTEVTIHQEHDTTNEMTDDNHQVCEERVELLQTEVMIHQEHNTRNEMTDENDGIFARFFKLFQIRRYFQLGTHRKNDTTNKITHYNDQVNEERVETPQTEVMIHQEHDTTNEMTDDNDQVNEERVELPQTEVMIHQEHDTTNEMTDDFDDILARYRKLLQLGEHPENNRTNEMTDNNDQVNKEYVKPPQTEVTIDQEYDTRNEMTDDNVQVNEERVEPPQTEVTIDQEYDTRNEMTDDNVQVNEERVELPQMEVMIHQEHDTTNEMTDENDGIFARFFKLFQIRRYFQLGTHRKNDTTNKITHYNDQVNEERVEPPQTEVMIHQEHATTNEMTDDNDQVNQERVELHQTEVMIHQEYDTTNEMTGDNDQVNEERVELPQTEVMIHQEYDTTNEMTDDNHQVNEERVELHQTEVMIHQEHDTTNEMTGDNDQVNEERVELHQTEVMIHQEHDTRDEMPNDNHGVVGRVRKRRKR